MKQDVYSAIGNEVRVRLLLCLANKSKNASDLIGNCNLAQSAVSQHLTKLKQARLVTSKKIGKEVVYSLRSKKIIAICKNLINLEKEII